MKGYTFTGAGLIGEGSEAEAGAASSPTAASAGLGGIFGFLDPKISDDEKSSAVANGSDPEGALGLGFAAGSALVGGAWVGASEGRAATEGLLGT